MIIKQDNVQTETTKETNNNLIKILGQGNEGKYTVITSTGLIDSVKLKTVLSDSNKTDTDLDGLYDWDEVNVDIVNKHLKNEGKQELKTINNSDLPLFSDLILHSSEWGSFKPYLWSESDFARYAYSNCFDNVRILPILSSPVDADGDNDGMTDICDENPLKIGDKTEYKKGIQKVQAIHFITYNNIIDKPLSNTEIKVSNLNGAKVYILPITDEKYLIKSVSSNTKIQFDCIVFYNDEYWFKIKLSNGMGGYINGSDVTSEELIKENSYFEMANQVYTVIDEYLIDAEFNVASQVIPENTGYELPYEPNDWNKPGNKKNANCYMYALNRMADGSVSPGFLSGKPINCDGRSNTKLFTKELLEMCLRDAYYSNGYFGYEKPSDSSVKYYPVALVFGEKHSPSTEGAKEIEYIVNGFDYHWYRKNSDDIYWSHKPGNNIVKNTDKFGVKISNPQNVDKGYDVHKLIEYLSSLYVETDEKAIKTAIKNKMLYDYRFFVGYFYVGGDFVSW